MAIEREVFSEAHDDVVDSLGLLAALHEERENPPAHFLLRHASTDSRTKEKRAYVPVNACAHKFR